MINNLNPDIFRVLQSVMTDGFNLTEINENKNTKTIKEVIDEVSSIIPDENTSEILNEVLRKKSVSLNETVENLIKDGRIKRFYVHDDSFGIIFASVYGRLSARLEINQMSLIELNKLIADSINEYDDVNSFSFIEFTDFEKFSEFKLKSLQKNGEKNDGLTRAVLDVVEITKDYLDKNNFAYTYENLTEIVQFIWKDYDYSVNLTEYTEKFLREKKYIIKMFLSQ